MAKTNSIKIIPEFPKNIDREKFGEWLSGFIDGEGCFILNYANGKSRNPTPRAAFAIKLRDDDFEIINLIHSYFQCGNTYVNRTGKNPSIGFVSSNCEQLYKFVSPHFDSHPLRAKKANDFAVWKKAVSFLFSRKSLHNVRISLFPDRSSP